MVTSSSSAGTGGVGTRCHRSARAAAAVVVIVGAATLGSAVPAAAHVSVSPSTTAAGAQAVVSMSFAHGCEGSPTTRVSIQIPEGINAVSPTLHPGWTVEKEVVALDPAVVDEHGNQLTERVASVTYTADEPVPDGYRDVLDLAVQLPQTPGEALSFATVQTCEQGESAWIEVATDAQDADSLELPAPAFEITEAEDAAEGGGGAAVAAGTDAVDEGGTTPVETSTPAGGGDRVLGIAALAAGLLGAVLGGLALLRQCRRA